MKVAIFQIQKLPQIGGGYTFENEMIQALLESSQISGHQFILYTNFQESFQKISKITRNNLKIICTKLDPINDLKSKIYRHSKALLTKIVLPNEPHKIESNFQRFIKESINREKADIIWSFIPMCLDIDIPYIVTVWDLEHRLQPYFPEVSIKGEWEHRETTYYKMLKRASFIITGTHRGKAEIEHFYQAASERIRVIPFPTPQFALDAYLNFPTNNDIFKKYNIPENYLFYPAQFWPHKNHIGLLYAIKYLREHENLIFPLVFVGSDQGNQSYIKQMIEKLNLSRQVHLLGFIPQEDLTELYRHAFALTFASLCGPDNLPPLEAFALGCPVIAANILGSKEQLGDAAILVDAADEKQIATAIKLLYDNPSLRQTQIQKGLIRASSWTQKNYIQEIFSILDEFEKIRRCWGNIKI